MPFIGRYKPPRENYDDCTVYRGACKTPWWKALLLNNTLWQCPKCGLVFRLRSFRNVYGQWAEKWEIFE